MFKFSLSFFVIAGREELRRWISQPDIAFLLIAFGTLALLVGFIRPGWVAPAVVGAFMVTLGTWAFTALRASPAAIHPAIVIGAGLPVLATVAFFLFFARRARRNKTDLVPQNETNPARSFQVR